jgi:hypothetical protein
MTLDATTTIVPTDRRPGSIFTETFTGWMISVASMTADLGKPGVNDDVEGWLKWLMRGGTRPRLNKRSAAVVVLLRNNICAALDQAMDDRQLNFHNVDHWELVERATRPFPGNVPLV